MSDSHASDANIVPPELAAEAARWCARMESDDVSADDELALKGWLADDPRRRAAYDAISQMTLDPALLAAMQEAEGARPALQTLSAWQLPNIIRPLPFAAVGLLSLLLWLSWPWLNLALTPETLVATAPGQTRTLMLDDGSRVDLSGGTSLIVRLGTARRVVSMQAGEAFFTIAPDAARPFIVETGDGRVQVLGTAFDLSQTRDGLEIEVHHGRVAFGRNGLFADAIDLLAGDQAELNDGVVSSVKHFDLDAGDWRSGWLQTDSVTLGGLAQRLSRRHGITVSVDPALADNRIAGRFRLNDPETLLRSLSVIHGFAVTRSDAGLLVSPAPR